MNGLNLIPEHRKLAAARRRRWRGWFAAWIAGAALIGAGCGVAQVMWGRNNAQLESEVRELARHIDTAAAQRDALETRLARLKDELAAANSVADQPDWSRLLAFLSTQAGDAVVLNGLRLEPAVETSKAAVRNTSHTIDQPNRYRLELRGFAQSAADVSQLALRLQAAGLFEDVKALRATREPFLTGQAVNFHIQCTLGEAAP